MEVMSFIHSNWQVIGLKSHMIDFLLSNTDIFLNDEDNLHLDVHQILH